VSGIDCGPQVDNPAQGRSPCQKRANAEDDPSQKLLVQELTQLRQDQGRDT